MSRRRGVPHRGTPKARQAREDESRATRKVDPNRNSDGTTWHDHMEALRAQNARFTSEQIREQELIRIDRAKRDAEIGRRAAQRERVNQAARDRDEQRRSAMEQDRRDREEAQRRHAETMERRNRGR